MKLVTGANGFVGNEILSVLKQRNISVRGAVRFQADTDCIAVGDIGPDTNWVHALEGVDTVIHTAARVHVLKDTSKTPIESFRIVNVEGTRRLAEQSALQGVRRLIYISSIKVNGETSHLGKGVFKSTDSPLPADAYAQSKWEAEQVLHKVAVNTGLEIVIIRSPLIYGFGVKANFLSMMCWLYRGFPLPLANINNKRSMIALDNLVDLIVTCIDHPAAVNQTLLASDDDDLSTTELLQRMAMALGRNSRLFPVPVWLLQAVAMVIGKRDVAQRLIGSLQLDVSKTKEILDWTPPLSVDDALRKTAEYFLSRQNC